MEGENILIASSIVVLQYRKYVVKKGSLFNAPSVTMQQKLQKSIKKTVKMGQNSQFLGLH